MALSFPDATLDAALNAAVRNAVTRVDICTTAPANYAGIAAVTLGNVTVDSSDFTLANGDTSGRKVTLAAQTGVAIGTTGTAAHLALSYGTTLVAVLTLTSQAVTSGNTATINAVDVLEIADVVAE
jgi:hypothetical protein